jgi:hypothetical protein
MATIIGTRGPNVTGIRWSGGGGGGRAWAVGTCVRGVGGWVRRGGGPHIAPQAPFLAPPPSRTAACTALETHPGRQKGGEPGAATLPRPRRARRVVRRAGARAGPQSQAPEGAAGVRQHTHTHTHTQRVTHIPRPHSGCPGRAYPRDLGWLARNAPHASTHTHRGRSPAPVGVQSCALHPQLRVALVQAQGVLEQLDVETNVGTQHVLHNGPVLRAGHPPLGNLGQRTRGPHDNGHAHAHTHTKM